MDINVVWLSYKTDEDIIARGYWDQGMLEDLFANRLWDTTKMISYHHRYSLDQVPEGKGAVVILPARHHADMVQRINEDLARLPWVLLILTGDEENAFPVEEVVHPNKRIYLMTPRFSKDLSNVDRFLGDGYPPQTRELIAAVEDPFSRPRNLFFAGQENNSRREFCIRSIMRVNGGQVKPTDGFTKGLPPAEYIRRTVESKAIPCPSGPETVDTFRLFEALECGCLPVADALTPHMSEYDRYWEKMFGVPDVPFPVVEDWLGIANGWDTLVNDSWEERANRVFAFWQNYKRRFVVNFEDDLISLTGEGPEERLGLTVLIPTSPIPSHPSTHIIEETVQSIRERLPKVEIFIMIDGIREQQMDRKADYDTYIRHLLWKCNHEWENVLPVLFEEHHHQAAMTREVIHQVQTPNILFVEHDTPLIGEIDFNGLVRAASDNNVNMIRLHHEATVLDVHQHMMLDKEPVYVEGVPLLRTVQWSQRPHVASVDFYKWLLDKFFSVNCVTMIEDTMHGPVHNAYAANGNQGWYDFKIWMYAPDLNDMKRSTHTDGRGEDDKFEMIP
ncbi:MAG: hypothetical protein ACWGQW_06050 [bacterium]